MSSEIIEWDEATDVFEVFCVFASSPEMRWFKRAWKGFIDAGKASYNNEVERHWVLARIITLGIMFKEFCDKAWDEKFDVESLICELLWDEDRFNTIILGNMVESDSISDDASQSDSFVEAICDLVYRCRIDVYNTLRKVFQDETTLFVSLWLSPYENIDVGDYSDELFDSIVNQDTSVGKMAAYDYVSNGMFGLDA